MGVDQTPGTRRYQQVSFPEREDTRFVPRDRSCNGPEVVSQTNAAAMGPHPIRHLALPTRLSSSTVRNCETHMILQIKSKKLGQRRSLVAFPSRSEMLFI